MFVPLLLAAACADPDATPPGGTGDSFRPSDVVLRVEHVGGFVAPMTLVERLPIFTLYGDGRVITQGAQIAIYPAPALPSVSVRTISPSAVGDLVRLALDAGVGQGRDYGTPQVTDLPSTRFTVVASGGVRQTEVYALGVDHGVTGPQLAARQRLTDLINKLTDLPGTLGEAAAGEETQYEPTALAVLSRPWTEPGVEEPQQEERPWPGPALPGSPVMDPSLGVSCLTVTGAELDTVLEAAGSANQLTPWVWDGQRYLVHFRPLLPDEATCADLTP